DAIARDEQERFAEVVELPHLASPGQACAGKVGFHDDGHRADISTAIGGRARLLLFRAMRLEVRDTAPSPRGKSLRIAFLHEAADPSAGAPAPVRGQVREACRVSGFRGREKETAGAPTAG